MKFAAEEPSGNKSGSHSALFDQTEIDPRKLLYFASIIDHGSLNRAARALEISQPALSTAMDRLESSLGVKVLDRSPRGIVPTSAGEILYSHARLIREEIELVRRDLNNIHDGAEELIRIGSLPSLSGSVIPQAISKWRRVYPERQFQVVESAQIDLITGLVRRDFDFVVGLTEVFDIKDGLRQQVLFRDLLCVNARSTHPLVGKEDLSWNDLMNYRWISVTSRWTHTILGHVMSAMNVGPPQQITVCNSLSLMKSLLATSDHLALLPAHASKDEREEGRFVALPFEDPILRRDIAVFFREGYEMDQPRRDLINFIKECGTELSRETATG